MAFGNKRPFRVLRTWQDEQGVKHVECAADFWFGGSEPDEEGHYKNLKFVECAGVWTRRGTPQEKFHPRKPSTCSYEPLLAAALR